MSNLASENCPQCGAALPSGGEQVICSYCGSRLIRRPVASQAGEPDERGSLVRGMRLKTFPYMDAQGFGMEAFRLLVPSGWEFSGGVQWRMNNPGMPAVIGFLVKNPAGEEAFEVFPSLSFYWTNNPMILMTFPRGSLYYGNEVQPPCGAEQALREIVLPRFRQQAGALEVERMERLPDLPGQLRALNPQAPPSMATADGAKVRFHYSRGELVIEEELYTVVQAQRMSMPVLMGVMETIFWSIDYTFSFRALVGRLDGLADLFQTVLFSFRLNPEWFARYLQLSQYMIQNEIRHINQIGQVSRIISQTSNQISDMIMESYNQRQATMDNLATRFSQAIRGVDEYYNPFEERGVELPGGYQNAWANSLGEYIVSDDANFNPNVGSNLNWEPLKKSD